MPRSLRYIPDGGSLVEVTTRTFQSRLLLTPKPLLNRIILGALARASNRYEVGVVAFCCLSNHYHLILQVRDADQLASFMGLFNSKLAKEVIRLTGWKGKVWSRRYDPIPISEEEGAQVGRLLYVLSHGCKEGLVARPQDWPGVHAVSALLSGESLKGTWYNRSLEHAARVRADKADPECFAEQEVLSLVPLRAGRTCRPKRIGRGSRAWSRRSKPTPRRCASRPDACRSGRGHPAPASQDRAEPDQEISRPALPRLQRASPPGGP